MCACGREICERAAAMGLRNEGCVGTSVVVACALVCLGFKSVRKEHGNAMYKSSEERIEEGQ